MKVFYPTAFAIILALSNADANPMMHGLHREGDHGRHGGRPFTQDMLETECDASFCDDIDGNTLDCDIESRPEHPDFSGVADEEKQDAWSRMEDTREAHYQQILRCACCTDATIEDLLGRDEGNFHGFGDNSTSSEDGSISSEDGSISLEDGSIISGDSFTSSADGSGRSGFDHGHGGGEKVQHMLDEYCPKIGCPNEDSESVECTRLDSTATRDERRKNALNCVCCRDDGVSELQDNNEEEVGLLLASLLTDQSDIQTKESFLNNPASHYTLSSALVFAAVGVIFANV
eukprot:CAMPEP_0201919598 /NCGR_PEP_ID=MMETSP0903-20130614/8433_1 /ASSEMBLY_ACC=CAM_ASM_000552 /TAXON_ID=420261 /ORGANISM="Thalassiosira antarctica, Strain CCMP982" /LENGTH=288 /DNA_ID=CAMNT_0048456151 /DNA_START=71 /DNA_END=937 /DNA_ORIENTATION=-